MATKKTSKKATAVKSSATKKMTKSETTTVVKTVAKAPSFKSDSFKLDTKLPKNLVNIVIAEVVGTFILTLAALFSASILSPLYVGLALMLIVMAVGAVSGAHVNPAVTFGLWTMRKLKTVLVPFYWGSQFLGAMAAVILIGTLTNNGFSVDFGKFMNFSWNIFALELVGTAVFMFGIAAIISRKDLKPAGQALGIGMSLAIALVTAGTLYPFIQSTAVANMQKEQAKNTSANAEKTERTYPREVYVGGATLNPAVALATTEKTDTQLQSSNPLTAEGEKAYSRLSLEVISATLIGAALGGNLFLLVNYRNKTEE